MRSWVPAPVADRRADWVAALVGPLGEPGFGQALLDGLQDWLPAASWSVYRAGCTPRPALYVSASRGVPDTTRDCWRAYLSGPYRDDRTLLPGAASALSAVPSASPAKPAAAAPPLLCHITAEEVPQEHRAKVYEAHGVAERVSVVQPQAGGAFLALNFYRHRHQRPFGDAAIADVGSLAPALLALVGKHILLAPAAAADALLPAPLPTAGGLDTRLRQLCPALTERERAVCVRLLQGMTQDGIAADLGLAAPTVKTYRNRAFARLGIHFRNELFARLM